jgi:hypothetical protein
MTQLHVTKNTLVQPRVAIRRQVWQWNEHNVGNDDTAAGCGTTESVPVDSNRAWPSWMQSRQAHLLRSGFLCISETTIWVEPGPHGCSHARPICFVQDSCVSLKQLLEWSLALMDAVTPGPFVSFRNPVYLWHTAWIEHIKDEDLPAFVDSWWDRLNWVNLTMGNSETFILILLYWRSFYLLNVLKYGHVWYAWNISTVRGFSPSQWCIVFFWDMTQCRFPRTIFISAWR